MMDFDWVVTAYTALVVLFATTIHGITGFGTGQITMGILPFFRDPGPASVIVSLLVFVTNVRVFWSSRDAFNWKDWLIPVIGLVVGLPVGVYLFGTLDQESMRVAIGIVMLVGTIIIALTRQVKSISDWIRSTGYQPGPISGIIAGFLSGVTGGAVSIPGPPMIIYGAFLVETEYWEPKQMKAIFTAFFATNLLYRLGLLLFTGDLTGELALEALIIAPALFLGTWIGIQLFKKLPKEAFRWFLIVFLVILSLLLIFGGGGD
jgi:uncharacterized protein